MSSSGVNMIHNRIYAMRCLLFPVIASMLFISCHNQYRQEVMAGIQMNIICQIEEDNHLVGHALSLDVSEDGSFIISNGSDIIGYDPSGHQTFAWNRKGRGPFEYLVAKRVRICEDTVYVWDSGSARFLAFDKEGKGIWTYDYDSAICDFYVTESAIYIYPCGRKWEYLVEELDLASLTIVHSLGSSSMAQKALQAMEAAVPLTVDSGSLYFMSRDKLDLYEYDLEKDDEPTIVKHFQSGTFLCSDIDKDPFEINPLSGLQFVFQNSYIVTFAIDGDSYKLLTAEGRAEPGNIQPDGHMKLSNDELVFRLYRTIDESQTVESSERSFDPALISVRSGSIFALIENPDNERFPYKLVSLE